MLHSVIMAGGSGTRFWPLSRKALPKQFLTLSGDRSLIQQAFDRCQPWIPAERTWVVTGKSLATLTHEHLPEVPKEQILLEPAARNTAPCLGLAALCLQIQDPDAIMLVMPADHIIDDTDAFRQDVEQAVQLVNDAPDRLVLFGISPSYPATGFGYIERGDSIGNAGYRVAAFREKPDRATAESYLRSGDFYWNSGIFVWRASRILEAIAAHEPELAYGLEQLRPHVGQPDWEQALNNLFPPLKSISIDYAVLEREQSIAVLGANFPWDDVGGWEAVSRLVPADEKGNFVIGNAVTVNSSDCVIRSSENHVIAILGMENCVIVQTPDATLIARRGDDEAIRQIIQSLQNPELERFL